MGKKKDNKEKKIKGAEKTRMKTEKNLEKKCKKLVKEKGEKDVEALVAECQEQAKQRQQVVEEKCAPPSPRCNMTLTAHPDKDLLIMFGGEYFNGRKTEIFDDLYFYNIKSNDWTCVKCPNSPAPRCSHQAVALSQRGGELWVFGGEFPSPTQSQYHHFRDLWLLELSGLQWRKISCVGGPSARSGHRMVAVKKLLVVFGGYHDNFSGVYTYYNDVHVFNTETCVWMKIETTGTAPSPRSGCVIASTEDQTQVVVYGGYSKERVKKDEDKGTIHTDMFMLQFKTKSSNEASADSNVLRCRWQVVKQSGSRPSPRCSASLVVTGGNRAFYFGGVFDEEDEESINGKFYNDMYSLDVDKGRWNVLALRKERSSTTVIQKKRRKAKASSGATEASAADEMISDDEQTTDIDSVVERLQVNECSTEQVNEFSTEQVSECSTEQVTTSDDGIFTVRLGGAQAVCSDSCSAGVSSHAGVSSRSDEQFVPRGRMNALLAMKRGELYLYGGLYEEGDRQVTLTDFYSLDLHRLQHWKTIIPLDTANMEWQESDEGSGSDEDSDDVDMDSGEDSDSD